MRLVLDSNVWVDWLVFGDPSIAPIRAAVATGDAEVFIDAAGEAELRRVLTYPFGKRLLEEEQRAACMAQCLAMAHRIEPEGPVDFKSLPKCKDRDDQKFLEAALAADADYLVTKDEELLVLAKKKHLPFRIAKPADVDLE